MFKSLVKHLKTPQRPTRLCILDFSDPATFPRIQTTSDSSLGGYSTAYFDPYRPATESPLVARFHGLLNPTLPKGNPKVLQSGWAMFKTKNRIKDPKAQFKPFYIFKSQANFWWDWSPFQVLHLRVLNLTPNRKFMVNVQTDTMSRTDLYQHRLFTRPGDNETPVWENIFIDLSEFVLTNRGSVQIQYEAEFEKDRIKSVGLSLADGQHGPFDLLVNKIEVLSGYDYYQEMKQARNSNIPLLNVKDEETVPQLCESNENKNSD